MAALKIVILSSRTGGGHQACAKALQTEFQHRYAHTTQVCIVDLWSAHTPFPLSFFPRLYPFLVQHLPWFWAWLWHVTKSPRLTNLLLALISKWIERPILAALKTLAPDVIICVHPIVQVAVRTVLQRVTPVQTEQTRARLRSVPWITVVTDLRASHPFWFDNHARLCFVDGPIAARHAQQFGLCADRVRIHGLPVHPQFHAFAETQAFADTGDICKRTVIRKKLGMDPTLPAALIVSGGHGIGRVERQAELLAHALYTASAPQGQLVIICGHNRHLWKKLTHRFWPIPVRICRFVENMSEWMAACDCVVTKAGPSTIVEACSSGLPLILVGYIPGQELANIEYITQNEAGLYCAAEEELVHTVRTWLIDKPQTRITVGRRAKKLSTPLATARIVDDIMTLSRERI